MYLYMLYCLLNYFFQNVFFIVDIMERKVLYKVNNIYLQVGMDVEVYG